jgi:hypothetical protein
MNDEEELEREDQADEEQQAQQEAEENGVELEQNQAANNQPTDQSAEVPTMKNVNTPVTDGAIPVPQDTSAIAAGDGEAPAQVGEEAIQFESGNWNEMGDVAQQIQQKQDILVRQIAPLAEVALIELLGQSSLYKRQSGDVSTSIGENGPVASFTLVYQVPMWIGTDVNPQDVQSDAKYVLDKIRLAQGATISKCAIDTDAGTLTISGSV